MYLFQPSIILAIIRTMQLYLLRSVAGGLGSVPFVVQGVVAPKFLSVGDVDAVQICLFHQLFLHEPDRAMSSG